MDAPYSPATVASRRSSMDAPYSPATLEGLTNAELRAIAARAGAITARRASKTPYPSRVPPSRA